MKFEAVVKLSSEAAAVCVRLFSVVAGPVWVVAFVRFPVEVVEVRFFVGCRVYPVHPVVSVAFDPGDVSCRPFPGFSG